MCVDVCVCMWVCGCACVLGTMEAGETLGASEAPDDV